MFSKLEKFVKLLERLLLSVLLYFSLGQILTAAVAKPFTTKSGTMPSRMLTVKKIDNVLNKTSTEDDSSSDDEEHNNSVNYFGAHPTYNFEILLRCTS